MKTITRGLVQTVLVVGIAVGCGLAQKKAPEKHVKDIQAEQTQDVILASALCQRVRVDGNAYTDIRKVDPATLEANLSALMQKSDEVVLAGHSIGDTNAISPSGKDVVEYFDVKILRTWRGAHKAGDILTFAVPRASVYCGTETDTDRSSLVATTFTGGIDWKGIGHTGPWVLFLRHSRGVEAQLTEGLRLTGGDGLQGVFPILTEKDPEVYSADCTGILPGGMAKCDAVLEASHVPVSVPYRLDPLKEKYDGMPVASFLKEVQAVADSLGYTGPAESAK